MSLRSVYNKNVSTVTSQTTVKEAAAKMINEHVGDVVVVEKDSYGNLMPVGFLTDRDIVRFVVTVGSLPEPVLVDDIMARKVLTLPEAEDISTAIQTMKKYSIRRLPIVNDHGFLVGIVSFDDLLPVLSRELLSLSIIPNKQVRRESQNLLLSERFY